MSDIQPVLAIVLLDNQSESILYSGDVFGELGQLGPADDRGSGFDGVDNLAVIWRREGTKNEED